MQVVATGIFDDAGWWCTLRLTKLRGNALWQVVLDGIDTNHGHDAPPEKPVLLARHVQLEPPLSVISIQPPVNLAPKVVSSSESVVDHIRKLGLIPGEASEHQAR